MKTKSLADGSAPDTCETCGCTVEDFRRTGLFGCADCYLTFRFSLETMLPLMHKGTHHLGKIPQPERVVVQKDKFSKNLPAPLNKLLSKTSGENQACV